MLQYRGFKSKCLFRKKDKIKKFKEINEVIKCGNNINYHIFNFFYLINNNRRIAIVFKNKDRNSVKRNKVKRIVRETFRTSKKQNKKDIVIKMRKKVNQINYKEIKEELKKIF